ACLRTEVLGRHLVVLHSRMVIGSNVLVSHLFGPIGMLVHKEKTAAERWRCFSAIRFPIHLMVDLKILLDDIPGFLRNHQKANTKLRHDGHGLRRHRRRVGTSAERLEWIGPNVSAWLLERGTTLDVALLQAVEYQLGVFDEALPPFVLVNPK